MKRYNILLIGEDVDKQLNALWMLNTNYTVLQCSYLNNKQFIDYIKKLKTSNITYITPENLMLMTINDVVDFCKKYHYTPIIFTRDRHSLSHTCYLALEDFLHNTLEYTINEKNEEYEEFLKMCDYYMKGK